MNEPLVPVLVEVPLAPEVPPVAPEPLVEVEVLLERERGAPEQPTAMSDTTQSKVRRMAPHA